MTNSEIKKELISAREKYINEIKAELAGPGSEFSVPDLEHELISASPISRYSVGILFPLRGIELDLTMKKLTKMTMMDQALLILISLMKRIKVLRQQNQNFIIIKKMI